VGTKKILIIDIYDFLDGTWIGRMDELVKVVGIQGGTYPLVVVTQSGLTIAVMRNEIGVRIRG
jgi:hypothetical protein